MRQKLLNGLRSIAYNILGFLLFIWIIVRPFDKGYPEGPIYYLISAALLLLSTLLFYVIWRFPRWEGWDRYRTILLFYGSCLAGSYPCWVYTPVWGFSPLWGHVLGLLIGAALGVSITLWENQAIKARKSALLAEQHLALDA